MVDAMIYHLGPRESDSRQYKERLSIIKQGSKAGNDSPLPEIQGRYGFFV